MSDAPLTRVEVRPPGPPLRWKLEGRVWECVLCAPPCNEIGTTMLEALERFVDGVEADCQRRGDDPDAPHSLILYSNQPGFCAGADLRELYRGLQDLAEERAHEAEGIEGTVRGWQLVGERIGGALLDGAKKGPTGFAAAFGRVAEGLRERSEAAGRARVAEAMGNAPAEGEDLAHLALQHRLLKDFIVRIHRVMNRLDMLPLTTIGVIHGVCFGGGFELALTCDLLIAEKTARFAFPELRLGIIPGFGGIPRLRREVGNAVIRDLLLTGRSINARKAAEVGLVSQMVPRGEGLRAARAMARRGDRFDAHARRRAKAFIKHLPAAELAREQALFLSLVERPAVREALGAFVESTDLRPYL